MPEKRGALTFGEASGCVVNASFPGSCRAMRMSRAKNIHQKPTACRSELPNLQWWLKIRVNPFTDGERHRWSKFLRSDGEHRRWSKFLRSGGEHRHWSRFQPSGAERRHLLKFRPGDGEHRRSWKCLRRTRLRC